MRRLRLAPAALLLLALAQPATAQWMGLRRGPSLIRFETRGGLTEVTGASEARTLALRFEERLQLSAAGWLLDPRVMTFSGSIMPTLGQHTAQLSDGMGRGQSMAYDLSTVLFPRRRISLSARTGRTSGFNAAELGSRNEWVGRTTNLGVRLKDRYFPINLTYSSSDGTSTRRAIAGQAPLNLAQSVERFQAELINPKLTLRYRRELDENLGYSSDPYRFSTTVLVDHRLRWGRGSSLSSLYQLQDRETSSRVQNHVWNETLRIVHTEEVTSRWEYRSRAWVAESSRFDSRSAGGTFTYRPAPFLSTDLTLRHQSSASSSGSGESGIQVLPSMRLQGSLPWNGNGALDLSGGMDRFTGRRAASDTWVEVLEEEHVIRSSLTFLLDNYRVEGPSIRIWTDDLSFELVRGIDFVILDFGGQVEVRILPTGRVQQGEVLRVTYRYLALEASSRSGGFLNARGEATFAWFTVGAGFLQRSGSDPSEAALGDPGLTESYLSLGLNPRSTPLGVVSLDLEADTRSGRGITTDRREVRATLSLPRRLPIDLDLRSSFSRTQTTAPSGLHAFSGSLQAGWSPGGGLRISGTTNYLVWDRDGDVDRFFSGTATLGWRWRDVIVEARMDQSYRWSVSDIAGTRWSLLVTRRF